MANLAGVLLAALFLGAGVTHFLFPDYYRSLVPAWVPRAPVWVVVAGVANLVAGGLILVPASRSTGAWLAAGLGVAYLVSHVDAVRATSSTSSRLLDRPVGVAGRLVVNLGYLGWAVWVARA